MLAHPLFVDGLRAIAARQSRLLKIGISSFWLVDKPESAFFGEVVTDDQLIGVRALALRKEMRLNQQEMADALGLSLRGWQRIERAEGVPNGESLMAFKNVGINPGWILTGLGPKRLDEKREPTTAEMMVFVDFLLEIAAEVEKAYRESGARLHEYDLVHASTRWLGVIQKMVRNIGDIDELRSLLPWIAAQVKREIADANAGKTKRAASD